MKTLTDPKIELAVHRLKQEYLKQEEKRAQDERRKFLDIIFGNTDKEVRETLAPLLKFTGKNRARLELPGYHLIVTEVVQSKNDPTVLRPKVWVKFYHGPMMSSEAWYESLGEALCAAEIRSR